MRKKRRSRTFKENNPVIDFDEERQKRKEKRQQVTGKKKEKTENSDPVSQRRATKMKRRRLIYSAICLFVVAVIGFSAYNIVSLRMERAEAAEAAARLEKEKARLEKELSQVDSDEYIENEARGQLHMIKPGETIYILPEDEEVTPAAVSGEGITATDGGIKDKDAAGKVQEE